MESVQISPCGFNCEREENWLANYGLKIRPRKYGHFDILTFLENKRLFGRTTYITLLIYLKAIYGQKMKESDFSTLATDGRYFLTVALKEVSS